MGIASDSLELIRRVFRRDQMVPGAPLGNDIMSQAPARGMNLGGSSALGVLSGGVSTHMQDALTIEGDLVSRYEDYEMMSSYPEISTALDLFADDATVTDVLDGKALWYEAPDDTIQQILNKMLSKQLRAEEDLWNIARQTCQWGNNFNEIVAVDGVGAVELRPLYVPATRRIQDEENVLYGYVFDPALAFTVTTDDFFRRLKNRQVDDDWRRREFGLMNSDMTRVYEPWEIVHFRMRSNDATDIYGVSIVDAARYAWRRLMMMEDAMMVYKLTRSPQRYAFYVDVGDVPAREAKRVLQQVKNEFKKTKFIDQSGKVNFHYNPLSADEDLFLATRKDGKRSTEVEVLSGPEGQQTDDVEYFHNKLISTLKVPKSYLAGDDTVGRANLAQLDVRMARSVMRIQRVTRNGFDQVARVDLAARNIDPDVVEYRAMMNVPSGVLEMAQMEVATAKMELGDRYRSAGFSDYWINSRILGMSDDEIAIAKGQREEAGGAVTAESRRKIRADVERDRLHTAATLNEKKAAAALTEIRAGQTEVAKRLKDVRLLVNEIRRALPKRKVRTEGLGAWKR